MLMANADTYGFDWHAFHGSREALKWNRRDLACLDQIVALVPGRTACVQAGANLGIYPKYLAKFFETVYCFEPAPKLFPLVMANAPEENIIKLQAALGDRRELVALSQTRWSGNRPTHEGITHVAGPGTIPTLRIDDLGLPVCDLICLDTEGWELFALRGAVQTLRRCRPVVSVEVNANIEYAGFARDDIRRYLQDQNYAFRTRLASDEVFVPTEAAC